MLARGYTILLGGLFFAGSIAGQELSPPPVERSEILISATRSPDPNVRESALLELSSELGGYDQLSASQAEELMPLLEDPDPDVRLAAINVLSFTADEAELIVNALGKMAKSPDFRVRQAVAGTLGKLGASDALVPLKELLQDPVPGIQVAALSALASIGSDSAPLIDDLRLLLSHENSWVAEEAINTVAALGRSGAELSDQLVGLLKSPDERIRYAAAKALGKTLAASTAPRIGLAALFAAAFSEEPEVPEASRQSAAQALLPLLADADEDIRSAAITSLGEIRIINDKILTGVIAGLSDATPQVRLAAVESINSLGLEGLGARPQIGALLKDTNRDVRLAALKYLVDYGPADDGIASDVANLRQDRNRAISTAAESVASIVEVLQDRNPGIQASIRQAASEEDRLEAENEAGQKSVIALREDGSTFPVAIGPKTLAVAVASWCPHSHSLVEFLRDEDVQRFIGDVELIFFVSDEGAEVRGAIAEATTSGKLSESEAGAIVAEIEAASPGRPYLYDSGWVASLPGTWYIADSASMPNSIPSSYSESSFDGEPIEFLKDLPSTPDALIEKAFEFYELEQE